jgi:protein-disulfide isomerase
MSRLPNRAARDIRLLAGSPAALVIALLFVGLGAWSASAFPRAEAQTAAVQQAPLSDDKRSEFERWWEMQPTAKMPFENGGAKVLIVEFADLQCPHCRAQYLAYKPILEQYANRPQDVKLMFRHWPFDAACNAHFSGSPHPAACAAAAAIVMARPKGTAEALTAWLFDHQEQLSPETVKRGAAEIGKITDFDAQYAKAIQEVKTDAALGSALGVAGTPAYFINGKRLPGGGMPPQYFQSAIDLELKKAK